MSKKKERKIKKLQRVAIWPTVLGMIITESVIFLLTLFICAIAFFGVVNSTIINNVKECYTVVNYVNKNWTNDSETQTQLNKRLSYFAESYSDIDEIIIDDKNNFEEIFPELKEEIGPRELNDFKRDGVIHFADPKTGHQLRIHDDFMEDSNVLFTWNDYERDNTGFADYEKPLTLDEKKESYDDIKFSTVFKSINFRYVMSDKRFISWALTEDHLFHSISIYKTAIPDVNVCFRICYRLNPYQFNLIVIILIFLFFVLVASGVYEIVKIIKIIYERKRMNQLVTTDTVTGGKNKKYFVQKVRKEILRSRHHYAVVQLRLEKYRNYCTAYGIRQGENLLEELYSELLNYIGKKEIVAHLEKSDFALLLCYQNDEALRIRITTLMSILHEKHKGKHLSFSAGVYVVQNKNDDANDILSYAGIAIPKQIKVQNEIVWFNDSMKEALIWERHIEDDMERALENHEFQVYLQPKYSTKKEILSAAEALVRWIHPKLGFISPGQFIPLFEKNGFILKLDDYMLTEVSRLQAKWLSEGKKLVPISVNVSRAHFAEEKLAEHICQIVDEFKVPHEYIELELTESAFFDDKQVLLTTVRKLKSFGFKVSMDDFGAGYSSLNSLKELPLDIIKLDAEFFRSVDDITRSNLIVGDTISLAKKLGMQIVAEGIETREQVDFLAKQNCDLIQGFYFSKPLPVSEFEEKAFSEK